MTSIHCSLFLHAFVRPQVYEMCIVLSHCSAPFIPHIVLVSAEFFIFIITNTNKQDGEYPQGFMFSLVNGNEDYLLSFTRKNIYLKNPAQVITDS